MQTNLRSLQDKINDLQAKLKKGDDKHLASTSTERHKGSMHSSILEGKNTQKLTKKQFNTHPEPFANGLVSRKDWDYASKTSDISVGQYAIAADKQNNESYLAKSTSHQVLQKRRLVKSPRPPSENSRIRHHNRIKSLRHSNHFDL